MLVLSLVSGHPCPLMLSHKTFLLASELRAVNSKLISLSSQVQPFFINTAQQKTAKFLFQNKYAER
jgi:hypothetical protein